MGARCSAEGRGKFPRAAATAVLQPRGLPAAFPVPQFPHLGPAGVRWWRAALPAKPGNLLPRVPPLRQEKKMVLIDLPCAAMWMQFPAQGVERGGAPVLLEETESRWVLGSAALPASGLTRPGLHPAPGSSGGDASGSRGQKSGVPGGELQPKSRCSDREHPERSCSSPQSSPLEGNAPSFLLPGSPPALACTRGAHGHFSAKASAAPAPRWGWGLAGATWGRAIDRRGRRQQRGAVVPCRGPVAGCERAAGPSARRGCGERLGWETAPCQKRFHRDLSPPTNVFSPTPPPRNNQGQGVHARACGQAPQGKQRLGCAPVPRRSDGGLVPLLARGGGKQGERAGKSQERLWAWGTGRPETAWAAPPTLSPAAWAPHGERLRWERLRHH